MIKIDKEEYEVLKNLDDKWKWIARDGNRSLFVYSEKPLKDNYSRDWGLIGCEWILVEKPLFQFIQWEDEEPCSIVKLIKDYEFGKILLAMAEEETVWELECENEEEEC